MQERNFFTASVIFALACALPVTVSAAPAAKPKAVAATASAPDKIEYENLHGYLGDRITVHTKYGTTRTGTLAKISSSELTLSIDTAGGATELTIPKNTIADMVSAPLQH